MYLSLGYCFGTDVRMHVAPGKEKKQQQQRYLYLVIIRIYLGTKSCPGCEKKNETDKQTNLALKKIEPYYLKCPR